MDETQQIEKEKEKKKKATVYFNQSPLHTN